MIFLISKITGAGNRTFRMVIVRGSSTSNIDSIGGIPPVFKMNERSFDI